MPRYTKAITPKELNNAINRVIQKNQTYADDVEGLLIGLAECVGTNLLEKDLSKFYFENALLKENVKSTHPVYDLLGVISIEQVTCFGALVGTDYGTPFYVILYIDDKDRLRGYIPKDGNSINPFTNEPFGEGDDLDDKIAQMLGYVGYGDMDYSQSSVQAHFYDIDRIKADIAGRIQLRP